MRKSPLICLLLVASIFILGPGAAFAKKRILFINSYHLGYPWSDGIERAAVEEFGAKRLSDGTLDNSQSKVEMRVYRMDTKRDGSKENIEKTTAIALKIIKSWRPDAVIASDDNASKYIIEPHFKGGKLPFIFCGVNNDSSVYGFPAANITGMEEVQLIGQIVDALRPFAKGDRVGFLKGEEQMAHLEAELFEKLYGLKLTSRFASSFAQWKEQYLELQGEVDILLLGNVPTLRDWDKEAALKFINEQTRIPTGNWDSWMAPYSLATFATDPQEQGQWAANAAKRILEGTSPADIPIVRNKTARTILNMELAKKLGVVFPMALIERSTFVGETK